MPNYSEFSMGQLASCHDRLQRVMLNVIPYIDNRIVCGHRGEEAQNLAYATGASTKQWGQGMHNYLPSLALDFAPWPIDWKDRDRFILVGGYIMGIARSLGVALRWGGDWNSNWIVRDERFQDLGHMELVLPADELARCTIPGM